MKVSGKALRFKEATHSKEEFIKYLQVIDQDDEGNWSWVNDGQ